MAFDVPETKIEARKVRSKVIERLKDLSTARILNDDLDSVNVQGWHPKTVDQYERPLTWYCSSCGHLAMKYNDYFCQSCNRPRPFIGGSATIKLCKECARPNLAISRYCEWCGSRF